ncbi:hypothetical protein KFK09_005724 [Dendrobium nobile]|uniref:Uncharacterized protein n=1 Tax=Dendrobium nobile TaxID=94219 RepID=A0A8T3C1V8_DENNO|nr:hypothetical protein KFK09_005724 [Dendrobium nobile]
MNESNPISQINDPKFSYHEFIVKSYLPLSSVVCAQILFANHLSSKIIQPTCKLLPSKIIHKIHDELDTNLFTHIEMVIIG